MIELHRVIGSLQQQRVGFSLDTTELCFLVTLSFKGQNESLSCFEEDLLYDVFAQVCESTEPDAQNVRKRATHALQRLREQRLLSRVDGAGLVRAGDYTLTPLAEAIVQFFLQEEQLTRESLAALTGALRSLLAEVLGRAQSARTAEEWQQQVLAPLRNSVRDLVSGIDRRQRGMDAQQEEVQAQIGGLLQRDWFLAIDHCEELLESTSTTLRELNEILLHDLGHLQAQLTDVESLASDAEQSDSVTAAQSLGEHVDRVRAWGSTRQRVWSEYYQFVQRYLRDVVRLDPERALSQRLRNQIKEHTHAPYALIVAEAPVLQVFREESDVVVRPPVCRPREVRERAPEATFADRRREEMDAAIDRAIVQGVPSLHALLSRLLPEISPSERFVWTGRITARAARSAQSAAEHSSPFVPIDGDAGFCGKPESVLVVQDLKLSPRRS
jgi:chromosome partition protein MukF